MTIDTLYTFVPPLTHNILFYNEGQNASFARIAIMYKEATTVKEFLESAKSQCKMLGTFKLKSKNDVDFEPEMRFIEAIKIGGIENGLKIVISPKQVLQKQQPSLKTERFNAERSLCVIL